MNTSGYRRIVALGASLVGVGSGLAVGAVIERLAFADPDPGALGDAVRAEGEIKVRLRSDADLMNNQIEVSVDNGIATLKGTVDSAEEKARAAKLAFVRGVDKVDNQLDVASQNARNAVADTAVTTRLKADILAEPMLKSNDIHVETNNGVVTLSGVVPSRTAHDRAAELARSVTGVSRVQNDLHVGPPSKSNH